MGAGSGSARGEREVHRRADELLIQQHSVPDGEITLPIQEETQHTHPFSSFLSDLVDVRRPGESFIQGYPQITSSAEPLDWFPEEGYWSRMDEAPFGTREDYSGVLRDINGDFPFTQPPLKVVEIGHYVADEQRRLAVRGYDDNFVRIEG